MVVAVFVLSFCVEKDSLQRFLCFGCIDTVVTVCSDPAWRESASLSEAVVDISADAECLLLFQVHVNLMMTEARMQAELLYALRAVNRYMT